MSAIAEELARTELFRDVPDAVLQMVVARAVPLELQPGDVLLSPDRENHHVYLLLSGTLALHFDSPDTPEIRELMPGVSVGEMSIIDGTPPSAYVIAKEASRVFPVHRDLVQHLVEDANPVARNLLRLMTRWIKTNTQRIVQDRKQIHELSDHAKIDGLTGLYNRRWLDNTLGRLMYEQPVCLLLADVDHFKRYNDTQGHLGGDQALITFANILKTTIRPYDFAARYGGEEFLVLLPNGTLEEGIAVAERIRQATEKQAIACPDGRSLPGITVSIGLAMSAPGSTPDTLIGEADMQLYLAKESGRNCYRYRVESSKQSG